MVSRSLSIALLALLALPGGAQDLLVSLAANVPGTPVAWGREEVLRRAPSGEARAFLTREALNVLFGDRDQNGILDDAPADIDALHIQGTGGVTDWLLSVSVNLTLADGSSLRDGDIFGFDGQGGVTVVYGEDLFAQWTGTSTVDVDAFAIGQAGELYFSFDADEVTSLASLISQNGGQALLDEQTVFRLDPGQSVASLHFTKTQVVSFFNQALGTSATSVVDVTGLTPDPQGTSSDLLLTSASSSQSLQGRIVSSAGGGTQLQIGLQTFDPSALGLGPMITLDALAFTAQPAHPVLRALPDQGSSSGGGQGTILVQGLAPGQGVHLVLTESVMPGPFSWMLPGTSGFGAIFPDPTHPWFFQSLGVAEWLLLADAAGTASYAYGFLGLTPGTRLVVQGVTPSGLALSSPAAVAILP